MNREICLYSLVYFLTNVYTINAVQVAMHSQENQEPQRMQESPRLQGRQWNETHILSQEA